MDFSASDAVITILSALTVWLGGEKVYEKIKGKKQKIDERQLGFIDWADELRNDGFTWIANVLTQMGVGSVTGTIEAIRHARKEMHDPDKRAAHFDSIFKKQLPKILESEERRTPFVKAYKAWTKTNEEQAAEIHAKLTATNGNGTPPPVAQAAVLAEKVAVLEKKANGPTLEEQQAVVNQKLDDLAAMVNGNKAVSATSKPAA